MRKSLNLYLVFTLITVAALSTNVSVRAQMPVTSQASADETNDLAHGLRLLDAVRDRVSSFDDPAFYWFCRYALTHAGDVALRINPGEAATPCKDLVERPGDYRGRIVLVEGVVQARHLYDVHNRPGLGTLVQCELEAPASGILCTVVAPGGSIDVGIGTLARAKGFFIKVRSFEAQGGGAGEGPLLVAPIIWAAEHHPIVSKNAPLSSTAEGGCAPSRGADFWVISGTAGLVVVWLVLRRLIRRTTGGPPARRGMLKPGGENDADFDWLLRTQADAAPDEHRQDSGTGRS